MMAHQVIVVAVAIVKVTVAGVTVKKVAARCRSVWVTTIVPSKRLSIIRTIIIVTTIVTVGRMWILIVVGHKVGGLLVRMGVGVTVLVRLCGIRWRPRGDRRVRLGR